MKSSMKNPKRTLPIFSKGETMVFVIDPVLFRSQNGSFSGHSAVSGWDVAIRKLAKR